MYYPPICSVNILHTLPSTSASGCLHTDSSVIVAKSGEDCIRHSSHALSLLSLGFPCGLAMAHCLNAWAHRASPRELDKVKTGVIMRPTIYAAIRSFCKDLMGD